MKTLLKVQSIKQNCYDHLIMRYVKQIRGFMRANYVLHSTLYLLKGKWERKNSRTANKYMF